MGGGRTWTFGLEQGATEEARRILAEALSVPTGSVVLRSWVGWLGKRADGAASVGRDWQGEHPKLG